LYTIKWAGLDPKESGGSPPSGHGSEDCDDSPHVFKEKAPRRPRKPREPTGGGAGGEELSESKCQLGHLYGALRFDGFVASPPIGIIIHKRKLHLGGNGDHH